jgi:uncharacterized membrane protein YphA (DoxX/SURF4 family)
MGLLQSFIAFLGRACIGIIFLVAGVYALFDWQGTEHLLLQKLCDWMTLTMGDPLWQPLLEQMINASSFLLGGAVVCACVGGLMVFLGITVRLGAFFLILLLISATLLMHPFWTLIYPEKQMQMAFCARNIGILGGLLVLLAYGNGKKHKERHNEEK